MQTNSTDMVKEACIYMVEGYTKITVAAQTIKYMNVKRNCSLSKKKGR
jgi:hypothetical protein